MLPGRAHRAGHPIHHPAAQLAVRLFANMLAGHLLLVSFAVITQALFESTIVGGLPPRAADLPAFELLVAFLQAYILTILAAVYIAGAMHPEH